jgi:predicted Zn-dependent peptidase
MGSTDTGMFVIEGKPLPGVDIKEAEELIWQELEQLQLQPVFEDELVKVKNKYESSKEFTEMNLLDKAMNLAFYELFGDANLINTDLQNYLAVTVNEIQEEAKKLFNREQATTLFYLAN